MLTKRPNHDRRPEIFRLAMEDFGVNHGADTSEFLPQLSIKTVLHIEVWRVKTDSVDAVLFCQPDGALIMKFLRDNGDMVFTKNLFGTGNDSNLLIVFYVQIMPDDFVMQLHRF